MGSEQEIRILKTGECPSLSGKSTLTYQIGCDNDNEVYIALTGNTGKGIYTPGWIGLEEVHSHLLPQEKLTSSSLHELFDGKSSNSAGFVLAVLLNLNLLKLSPGNRHYDFVGQAEFGKIVQAMLDSGVSPAAEKKVGKKSKGGS